DLQRPARGKRDAGPPPLRAHASTRGARAHREAGMKPAAGSPLRPLRGHLPINGEEFSARTWEVDRAPDLVDLVSAARDAGHEVMLIERPMPDAVSVAAIGRVYDIVAAPAGVSLEDENGRQIDGEKDDDRLVAAARPGTRVAPSRDAVAVGGFAYRP